MKETRMSYKEHGGDIYRNQIQYDFSINVNPLGMPKGVVAALRDSIPSWSAYPDPECEALRKALAEHHGCGMDQIICGNGAAELIYQLVRALKPRKALIPVPTFSEYERALRTVDCMIEYYRLKAETDFHLETEDFICRITSDTDVVFLCNPNNPNGLLMSKAEVRQIAKACREHHAVLVLDECFMELTDGGTEALPEVVRIRAFTKTYAMAGLRLGYLILEEKELCDKIRAGMQPWAVSVPAMTAGLAALKEKEYLEKARSMIREEREYLTKELQNLGYRVFPSEANYILFYTEQKKLYERLLEQKILIRDCSNYEGLGDGYYRVCVKGREENAALVDALKHL
jgi:threonine-phosphate decarboxylase